MSTTVFEKIVDVTGYQATGLTALAIWYTRNDSGDASSASKVTLTALDASNVTIGSATSSSDIVGPQTTWKRSELTKTLPAGTAKVKFTVTLTNGTAKANVDDLSLHIGQMSDELISNGSFTNGTFTSWTNVTNSFTANTTTEYASDDGTLRSAQGGAFASSEIKQEVAIPAGYEYGDAVLTIARSNEFADNGTVTLEVLDGGGAVIASETTGAESIADGWERRKLIATLPDGAATLRVRLIADRALGAGSSGALFDDVSLRIHKDLDPVFERELDFSAPARSQMPLTWQDAYLAWPSLAIPAVWNGDDVLPSVRASQRNAAATAAWSDGSTPSPAKFVGYWKVDADNALSCDAYRFARSGADIEVDGYGSFAKADSFSVAVCFRVTERAMSLACGLVGNRGSTGWGLSLDASGRVVATLVGTSTRTATGTIDHRDGAPHWVLLTWNGSTLTVADAAGSATNAGDPGEFASSEVMRIGSDGVNEAGGVDIARVLVWDGVAIAAADFASTIDVIGDDPNGLVTWTSSQPVWIDGGSDADGVTLVRAAARHVPIGYSSTLGHGLSIGQAATNLVLSTDFASGSHCGPEADVLVAYGTADPTGLARGVTFESGTLGFGYRLTDLPIGLAAGTLRVVLYLRNADPFGVSHLVKIRLLDADGNTVDSEDWSIASTWQRVQIDFTWTGATPTGHIKIASDTETNVPFVLGSVAWAALDLLPTAYPDTSVGDRHGAVGESLPLQFHREGEIETYGIVTSAVHGSWIASTDNDTTDQKNQRAISISSLFARGTLWDNGGVPTSVNAAPTWTDPNVLRFRWNRLELPESLGKQQSICIGDTTQDDLANAFSLSSSTPLTKIRLGGGNPNSSTSPDALLQRVVVRAREEKLS